MAKSSVWGGLLKERDRNLSWIEKNLCDLDYAGLYLGDEMNTYHFDWEAAIKDGSIDESWRVVFSNMMASGLSMSAPAIALFYQQLHDYFPDWVVERTMCPPTGFNQELMKRDGIRPFAVESKMPLEAFDVICMSMDLSGSAAAVPWLILEGGIPLYSKDRSEEDSFVILGGSALVNPAPYAPFCDILFMGEGEEILPQLLLMMKEGRRQGRAREEILLDAARKWDCLYVPRFYEERYRDDGRLAGTFPLRGDVPKRIRINRVKDLDKVFVTTRPFVNFSEHTTYNTSYEISRGCEGKCAFCLGGFTSLPYRARSAELVKKIAESTIYETGNTSATPVSFNSVSHPQINRIIDDLSGMIGDRIRLVSMRMDGFHNNPELCCYISMQKRGRIAFGVEGASQRLRDLVSKNLSEEQILDTMHEVCRRRFAIVKFMMICNLPSETPADLDELYELAVKIKRIFEEETPPGAKIPKLLISWNSLLVSPHTPLQWAPVKTGILPAYEEFCEKILALGFSTFVPQASADDLMTHFFLRGDGRMAQLLAYMAGEGMIRHDEAYSFGDCEKAEAFMRENGLPPREEWLREYSWEDALPWDIVESPASKEYLYRRYMAIEQKKPASDPICTESCSGCGACVREQLEVLRAMPARREKDRIINLHHPVKKTEFRPVQHVLLEYSCDDLHSVVMPSYWDCEIRRALFHAGVDFDPDSVESFGSRMYERQLGSGANVTCISLGRVYDTDQLRRLIEKHAVNFRVVSVTETRIARRVALAEYRMSLPEGTDKEALRRTIEKRLGEEKWLYGIKTAGSFAYNLRPHVTDVEIRGDDMHIKLCSAYADPRLVFRFLLDIPEDELIHQMPERTGFTFENKGILDIAMTREMRDRYIRSLEAECADAADGPEAAYIAGAQCFNDIDSLFRRDYSVFKRGGRGASNGKYLLRLIEFTVSAADGAPADDPSLEALRKYLNTSA